LTGCAKRLAKGDKVKPRKRTVGQKAVAQA